MLIDWVTVAAEIVNFLVLAALLKRFLYGPLIRAIDGREARIAKQVADAAENNRIAAARIADAQARLADLEAKREGVIASARDEAEKQRVQMLLKARESVRDSETKWRGEMERERTLFLEEMRRRAAAEILAISRRAVGGLASADLERCAVQAFLTQIEKLDAAALEALATGDLVVATPGDLPPETQGQLREAIAKRLGTGICLHFEHAASMPWGIELRSGGLRIGWVPDTYLNELEGNLKDAFDRAVAGNFSAAA